MHNARVLTLLPLLVQMVNGFSWDIVVGETKRLDFYYNGTLTHTEDIPSADRMNSVTYDPVHYRVLFAGENYSSSSVTLSSFDLSTRKIQPLVTNISAASYVRVVYDPVTQLLFWKGGYSIHSFSLNPASSNKAVDGNLLFALVQNGYCRDIAVESCGGYIYWITDYNMERARFDGSEREVLIDSHVYDRRSLAIDQQTQKMYWTETIYVNGHYQLFIERADFNGKNRTTLHIIERNFTSGYSLAVSKDFIYWKDLNHLGIWQLPKIPSQHLAGKLFSMSSSDCSYCHRIAANYTIQEQIQGTKSCEALKNLVPNNSKPESTVSICQNYCFKGDCSVSAEGQPTCSCKAGYSGERCEVNTCHKHCLNSGVCTLNEEDEPVCQCSADYDGERCEVSTSKDNCASTASTEGENKLRYSNASNSGERKGNACHQYCLNDGICSLNEESEPVCQCTADYDGERCDVPAFLIKCFLYAYKNVPSITLSKAVKSTCASTVV